MTEKRRKEIRKKADTFREKCKISNYGIMSLFKDCERLGYKLLRYPIGEASVLGFVKKMDDDIVIFTNTSSRLSREIFTLAHELGHVALHMDAQVPFIDDAVTISDYNTDEREQEANYFAASLLMPADEVERFMDLEINASDTESLTALDIARIMSAFHVSFEMVLNRLESLKKITEVEKATLDNEKNISRVGNLLRSVGGEAKLNIPSGEIVIPYEYLDETIFNYNHNAIPMETLEKTLACYKLSLEDISDQLVEHVDDGDLDRRSQCTRNCWKN